MALGDGRGQRPSPPGRLGAQNLPHTKHSELLERNGKRAQYFTSHRLRLHPVAAVLTCLLKRHAVQSTISRGYQVEMPIDAALTSWRDPLLAPHQPRRFCNPGSSGSSLFPGSCPGTPERLSRQPIARAARSARMRLKFGKSEPNASWALRPARYSSELGNEIRKMAHGAEPTPGQSGFDTKGSWEHPRRSAPRAGGARRAS